MTIDLFGGDEPTCVTTSVTRRPDDQPTIGFLEFHGYTIPVAIDANGHWVSVTRLSDGMGIDSNGQRQALERKHWTEGMTCVMHVVLPGQSRAYPHFFIHEKRLPMWLANIDTTRLKDENVRARVEATQVEFADVLAEWAASGEVKPTAKPLGEVDLLDRLEAEAQRSVQAIAGWRQERERATAALTVVKELAPAAAAWDRWQATGATLDVGAAAKYLIRLGVDTGRNRLYDTLRDLGWVFRNSQEPMGTAVHAGYVEVEGGRTYVNPKTGEREQGGARTRLTTKGLERLAQHFVVNLDHQVLGQFIDLPTQRQIGA